MMYKQATLRKMLGLMVLLLAAGAPVVFAQSNTYENVGLIVNVGNPGNASFIFGHGLNGQPGTTELVIQCIFDRAELFTDVGVYNQEQQSQFFAVTCAESEAVENGVTVLTFTLNSTPLSEALVMYGFRGSKTNLNLTANSTTWTVVNPGRYQKWSGTSQIVVAR